MLLSVEHLLAVTAIVVLAAALVVAARLRPGPWTRTASVALAVILVGAEVGWWAYLAATGARGPDLASAFPFQLCDAAIFIAAVALVLRTQLLVEVTYFWGLAGTMQAVITPDLPQHFPTFLFFQYYVAHGGIVAAALFLVVGLGHWPRRDAVLKVALITILYALMIGAIDAATGANYMYLRSKPASENVLDLLGPWPVYIGWGSLVGMGLLLILDAPFRWLRQRRGENN
ncbi:MAG: TIGR02206 family membrane protein [Candidatus Dormibacteraceae bacterium]